MTIQTIELSGERYVILPEQEFLELQQKLAASPGTNAQSPGHSRAHGPARFRDVVPLRVGGVPASQLLIQDRR